MPEKKTAARAAQAKRAGKSPSSQAGVYVREEIEHLREGKHGARSPKQAIAIGLSKARRAGVALPPPKRGSRATKKAAARDSAEGQRAHERKPSAARSRASKRALGRESTRSTSRGALSTQAKRAAKKAARTRAAQR